MSKVRRFEDGEGLHASAQEFELSDGVVDRAEQVIGSIWSETLPEGHFRDCSHFAMAMCELWMPTHRVFERGFEMGCVCDESSELSAGPAMLGIPNDARCLGFEGRFVYNHAVFITETRLGQMCLYKVGVEDVYEVGSLTDVLRVYDAEVIHPLQELWVTRMSEEVFRWEREAVF